MTWTCPSRFRPRIGHAESSTTELSMKIVCLFLCHDFSFQRADDNGPRTQTTQSHENANSFLLEVIRTRRIDRGYRAIAKRWATDNCSRSSVHTFKFWESCLIPIVGRYYSPLRLQDVHITSHVSSSYVPKDLEAIPNLDLYRQNFVIVVEGPYCSHSHWQHNRILIRIFIGRHYKSLTDRCRSSAHDAQVTGGINILSAAMLQLCIGT
jgi:hypothetical protein